MKTHMSLEERLALLQVEDNDHGRHEARSKVLARRAHTARRKRRRGWLLAGGAALLLVVSPVGQSVAGAVGDLVGIGDEPSGGPQFLGRGEVRNDTVIAVGRTPSDDPFELVTSDPGTEASGSRSGNDSTCVYTNFPDANIQANLAQCLTVDALAVLARGAGITPALTTVPSEPEVLLVDAYAGPDIRSLALKADDRQSAMTSGVLRPATDQGRPETVRFGVGFVLLPSNVMTHLQALAARIEGGQAEALLPDRLPAANEALNLLSGIEVVGLDADGVEIARKQVVSSPADALAVLMTIAGQHDP